MNNPTTRQQWIYDELVEQPALRPGEMWAKYGQKWAKGKTTFDKDWAKANERFLEYQQKANEAKEQVSIQNEVEALKSGIKSKTERVFSLQRRAEAIEADLEKGKIKEIKIISGKKATIERDLDVYEKTTLAKTYKDLIAEIAKMQGDYADKKKTVTHKFGVDAEEEYI